MHVANTNHSIDWANAKVVVVKTVPGYWKRRTTEAILIKESQDPMNLDNGFLLPGVWNTILLNTSLLPHSPHDNVTQVNVSASLVYSITVYLSNVL